jgi:hypothetical protein
MIYTNAVIAPDELVYSDSTLAKVAEFRTSLEQQENSLEYWQRHSDEWYERMADCEFEILERSPEYIELERRRELESIAFLEEIEAEEHQSRLEELAYFGLDAELSDEEHRKSLRAAKIICGNELVVNDC